MYVPLNAHSWKTHIKIASYNKAAISVLGMIFIKASGYV